MVEIRELSKELVRMANFNSFNGTRGDSSERGYMAYAETVVSWPISDERKQKILDELYKRWSKKLSYEARHVSVMVAGPARYNAKRLDHGDQVLQASAEIVIWFKDLEEQVERIQTKKDESMVAHQLKAIETAERWVGNGKMLRDEIAKLFSIDGEMYVKVYEHYDKLYKFPKNTIIYKLYMKAKSGDIQKQEREIIYEDANLTAFIEGDRAYIKFVMRPKRQLIVAMKSRKWWWNARKGAWSTYTDRVDREWVSSISDRYAQYV